MLVCRAATDLKDLGIVAGIDAVAGCMTGVARHDGEVGAGDGEDGAAVVGVSGDEMVSMTGITGRSDKAWLMMYIRVEAVLPEAIVVGLGSVVKGVVGPVHEGVLAEHGSHPCDCDDLERTDRWMLSWERSGDWFKNGIAALW